MKKTREKRKTLKIVFFYLSNQILGQILENPAFSLCLSEIYPGYYDYILTSAPMMIASVLKRVQLREMQFFD